MNGARLLRHLLTELDGAARREIGAAASEGRFDELPDLASFAKEIAALAARWGSADESEPMATSPSKRGSSTFEDQPASKTPSRSGGKSKKAEYPQFLREKEDLVKLGWSPRDRGPYEHRVSKVSVDAVAAAVVSRGRPGHRFTMEEIHETLAGSKGYEPLPSYQVYAVLSWMKWAGMVIQHGRQGYTIVRVQTLASSIESAWQSLPRR